MWWLHLWERTKNQYNTFAYEIEYTCSENRIWITKVKWFCRSSQNAHVSMNGAPFLTDIQTWAPIRYTSTLLQWNERRNSNWFLMFNLNKHKGVFLRISCTYSFIRGSFARLLPSRIVQITFAVERLPFELISFVLIQTWNDFVIWIGVESFVQKSFGRCSLNFKRISLDEFHWILNEFRFNLSTYRIAIHIGLCIEEIIWI